MRYTTGWTGWPLRTHPVGSGLSPSLPYVTLRIQLPLSGPQLSHLQKGVGEGVGM